jgi:hypothetical protein
MRATKAPPRGPATRTTQVGQILFNEVQCSVCHTPTLTTAPEGTSLNGGQFVVDASLGGKTIHPYSDFLLHDVGTGDGIPVSPDHPETKNVIRTAPLWGLRTRNRLMHDGLSYTFNNATQRHEGQARSSKNAFNSHGRSEGRHLRLFGNLVKCQITLKFIHAHVPAVLNVAHIVYALAYNPLPARLVLVGEHDSEDAQGLRRVGGIGGAVLELRIVVVDLPEEPLSLEVEGAEVVLTVGVVRVGEGVIGAPFSNCGRLRKLSRGAN